MEYKVVTALIVMDLETEVRHWISEGWQPLGGVSMSQGYAQAMIRITPKPNIALGIDLPIEAHPLRN